MISNRSSEGWLPALLFATGLGLFLSPWLLGFAFDPEPFVSITVLGLVLFVLGAAAAAGLARVAAAGAMSAGAWSMLVPLILDLREHPAFWIHIFGGLAAMLIGIAASERARGEPQAATQESGAGTATPRPNPRWLIVRGALALALGVLAIIFPANALFAFTMVFAAFALVDGLFSVASGISGKLALGERRWAPILRGAVGILAGIMFIAMPLLATLGYAIATLALLSGWSIMTGALEIASAVRLRKEIEGEWLLGLSGLLSILLGLAIPVILYLFPAATILSVAWMIGVYALAVGIVLVAQGVRLSRAAPPEPAPQQREQSPEAAPSAA